MKQETIKTRINNAIKRYIPDEEERVQKYIFNLVLSTYRNLREDVQCDDNGKPYSESKDLAFAISITLDDVDTPMILQEARKDA